MFCDVGGCDVGGCDVETWTRFGFVLGGYAENMYNLLDPNKLWISVFVYRYTENFPLAFHKLLFLHLALKLYSLLADKYNVESSEAN